MTEYVPSGPSDSARVRSFAEGKMRALGESDLVDDKYRFGEWMTALNNELLGVAVKGGPKERLPRKKGVYVLGGDGSNGGAGSTHAGSAAAGPMPITSEMRNPGLSGLSQLREMRERLAQGSTAGLNGPDSDIATATATATATDDASREAHAHHTHHTPHHTPKVTFETGAVVAPGADFPAQHIPTAATAAAATHSGVETGMMHEGEGDLPAPAPALAGLSCGHDTESRPTYSDEPAPSLRKLRAVSETTAAAAAAAAAAGAGAGGVVEPSPPASYSFDLDFSGKWAKARGESSASASTNTAAAAAADMAAAALDQGQSVHTGSASTSATSASVDLSGLTREGARRFMGGTGVAR